MNLSLADTPTCGPFDVMVAPRFVGLCGTDIQIYRGAIHGAANVLGHEGVGVVTEVGSEVDDWFLGDAVAFNPVNPVVQDDALGRSFDGLFQERFLIENAGSNGWLINRIPINLLTPVGALIAPVSAAIYSSELADVQHSRGKAVVVGDGSMALLNSMILRLSGFESVLMIHGDSGRGDWAVQNGYFDQGDVISRRGDVAGNVIGWMGGELADVAIICTPGEAVEQAARDAMAYLKPGGLINFISDAVPPVISLGTGDLKVHELQLRNHCGLPIAGYAEGFDSENRKTIRVTGQHGISSAHIQASVTLLIENPEPFGKLITEVVNFDDAHSFISSAVEWSLGRGVGDRPMKTVIEINGGFVADNADGHGSNP